MGSASFKEFPAETRFFRIPEEFFSQILPEIGNLLTLKVILYAFWKLEMSEREIFYLTKDDYLQDSALISGFGFSDVEKTQNLETALKEAVSMNVFLAGHTPGGKSAASVYFLNTPSGRVALKGLENGNWKPGKIEITTTELMQQTSNAFKLYEENVGPLTPMIAEKIGAAEADYPAKWIEEAISEAVVRNKRSWNYIEAILKRWQAEGR